jgi:hypothetical protein
MVLRIRDFAVLLIMFSLGAYVSRLLCRGDRICRVVTLTVWMLLFLSMFYLIYKFQQLSNEIQDRIEMRTLFKRD